MDADSTRAMQNIQIDRVTDKFDASVFSQVIGHGEVAKIQNRTEAKPEIFKTSCAKVSNGDYVRLFDSIAFDGEMHECPH
jgi:hypothetical protein